MSCGHACLVVTRQKARAEAKAVAEQERKEAECRATVDPRLSNL